MLPFNEIRAGYRHAKCLAEADPYFMDWTALMSPIERMMWTELQSRNLKFWPQYPIGKYFADFADPERMIVVECDGAAFHDPVKDAIRDRFMASEGWTVYRISGSDCFRSVMDPNTAITELGMDQESRQFKRLVADWLQTGSGLAYRIAARHYGRNRQWLDL